MALRNYLKGDTSNPRAPGTDHNWTVQNGLTYIGIVKGNKDPARMGRLSVLIPSLAKTLDPDQKQLITCDYLSPFYGAKPDKYNRPHSRDYAGSQHSYGFWAVPPDLETRVLVIFAEGKTNQAYWIGCIQDPYTNHMIPGIASSENTFDKNDAQYSALDNPDTGVDKESSYGSITVPAGELNRSAPGALLNNNYDSHPKPIHPLADILVEQGLSADDIRGNTSSSARRESPSNVFGISTPGPKNDETTKVPVGTKDSGATDYVTRRIGHTFVMDDGDESGDNQLTRLRTASGHQLLMHDTEGCVYIANGSGKAFIEMDIEGRISIYSDAGIAMRSRGDFNLHSDKNIHFHARENIKFTSEENLMLNSEQYIYSMGKSGILNASQGGSIRNYGKDGITSYTDGQQLHGAGGRIDLAGSQVHFNSRNASDTWGPTWLKPDHDKVNIITKEGEIDIEPYAPLGDEGRPWYIESKTTVRDTSIVRGSFSGDIDPYYTQPKIEGSGGGSAYDSLEATHSHKKYQFDNAWQELEALIGPTGQGVEGGSSYDPNLDARIQVLMAEFKIVTPFMDKENGVGNMAQKKKEFFEKLRERQKYTKPDQVGGVFVTHEPFKRQDGVESKKPMNPNDDPYYVTVLQGHGVFENEWLEMEYLFYNASSPEDYERRDELIKKYDIDVVKKWNPETQKWEKTGDKFAGNMAEKRAEFYEGLGKRQETYQSLSSEERINLRRKQS